jgi:hypothetical protein
MNKEFWLGIVIEVIGWMVFSFVEGCVLFFVVTDPWWVKLVFMVLIGIFIYAITGLAERKLLKKHSD